MTCLVHDPHYRSLFHGVVNELRNEKRISPSILRNMPGKCCTCKDIDQLTLVSVVIPDKETLHKLQNLIIHVDRNKSSNPQLVLALNRLENFIKLNRGPASTTSTTDVDTVPTGARSAESRILRGRRSLVENKASERFKNGTFLFLPYNFQDKPDSDASLEAAKTLQRGRFFGRHKYVATLEEQHNICINMITSTTSEQIKRKLNNAKAGIGKMKIHNPEDVSEDGEWILVREKISEDKETTPTDLEALLNEIKNRWDSFLKIQKRKIEEDDDDDEHSGEKS